MKKNVKLSEFELQLMLQAIDMYKKELEATEFPERSILAKSYLIRTVNELRNTLYVTQTKP